MTRCALLSVGVSAALAVIGSVAPSLSAAPSGSPAQIRMIVVIDPGCPQALPMLERVAEFRRIRPDIPMALAARPPC